MPDTEGRLSPAEIEYILSWVQKQAGGKMPVCPISHHTSWHVAPNVSQALKYPVITVSNFLADQPYPYVTLLCIGCGYYMLFNASLMGLYPPPPPPPPGGSNAT